MVGYDIPLMSIGNAHENLYKENAEMQNGTHTEEQKGIKRYHWRRKSNKIAK